MLLVGFFTLVSIFLAALAFYFGAGPSEAEELKRQAEGPKKELMGELDKAFRKDPLRAAKKLRKRSRKAGGENGTDQDQLRGLRHLAPTFPVPELFQVMTRFRNDLKRASLKKGVSYDLRNELKDCLEELGNRLEYHAVLKFIGTGMQILDEMQLAALGLKPKDKPAKAFREASKPKVFLRNDGETPHLIKDLAPEIFLIPTYQDLDPEFEASCMAVGVYMLPMKEIVSPAGGGGVGSLERYRAHVDGFWKRIEIEIGQLPPPPSLVTRLAWSCGSDDYGGQRLWHTKRWFATASFIKDKTTRENVQSALQGVLRATVAEPELALEWVEANKELDKKTKRKLRTFFEFDPTSAST